MPKIAKNPYNHAMANLGMNKLAFYFEMLAYLIITESGKKFRSETRAAQIPNEATIFKLITKYLGIYTKPRSYGCKKTK